MRIISGTWKSRRINPPKTLPVRPTTDIAKEALFNIIENRCDMNFENALDLFAGTGNISYELASRGAKKITAVDQNFRCVDFISKTIKDMNISQIQPIRADVFSFLKKTTQQYDLVFADPPYELPQLNLIPNLVFEQNVLSKGGWLIVEHPKKYDFGDHPNFFNQRNYGKVNFSFFRCLD
jgi:16S rRNA (guanine(966)-N(2))-methyltransferase RsmD